MNALYRSSEASLAEQRMGLVRFLQPYQRAKSIPITVVFDGAESSGWMNRDRVGGIDIVYTTKGESADEWIIADVERRQGQCIVVTNDREIITAARGFEALNLSCEEFLARIRQTLALEELPEIPFEKIESESRPLYPKVTTKKRGASRRLPKKLRKKQQILRNL